MPPVSTSTGARPSVCIEPGQSFCDAVQTVGKMLWSMESLGADQVCISAHKMYGPKGVGALITRDGIRLLPQVTGGGQELGFVVEPRTLLELLASEWPQS